MTVAAPIGTAPFRPPCRVVDVTHRESQVAYNLVWDGADNATIARRLGLAEETVKHYMKSVLRRTGYATRTQLVVAMLRGEVRLRPVEKIGRSAT